MDHVLDFTTTDAQLAGWQLAIDADLSARQRLDPKATARTIDELMVQKLMDVSNSYADQVSDGALAVIMADAKADPDVFKAIKAARDGAMKVDTAVDVVDVAQPGLIARAVTAVRNMFGGESENG